MARYGLGERGAADVPLEERARAYARRSRSSADVREARPDPVHAPDLLPPEFITELSKLQDECLR